MKEESTTASLCCYWCLQQDGGFLSGMPSPSLASVRWRLAVILTHVVRSGCRSFRLRNSVRPRRCVPALAVPDLTFTTSPYCFPLIPPPSPPGLPHTIVRPGPLEDGPATGTAVVTESPTGYGGIVRADLAALLVGAAASPLAAGKTFTAVDRTKYVKRDGHM